MVKQPGLLSEFEWRLTLYQDPKGLNAAIQREHHLTPTLDDDR